MAASQIDQRKADGKRDSAFDDLKEFPGVLHSRVLRGNRAKTQRHYLRRKTQ